MFFRLKEKNEIPQEEVVQQRPQTGKVANVIVDDGTHEDDADEFLVEEKPKDNLDLDTENTSVDVNVSLSTQFCSGAKLRINKAQFM